MVLNMNDIIAIITRGMITYYYYYVAKAISNTP